MKKDEPEALVLYGKLLIKEKEPKLAAEALEKVISQCDPNELTDTTSNVIKNQRDPSLERVKTDFKLKPSIFFYLAQAYEMLFDYKKSLQMYKKCLQKDPNHF